MNNVFKDSYHIYKYWHNKNNDFNNLESIEKHAFRSVENGRIVVSCQGKTFIAQKGDLLYIPLGRYADIKIFAEPNCHGTVLRVLHLPVVDILGYLPQVIKMDDELTTLFNDIPIINLYVENINSHIIYKIYKFLDAFQKKATPYTGKYSSRIENALDFMKENDIYSINDVAEYCDMSERRLRVAFNKILGNSPVQIKQRIQTAKANLLLKTTELSVEEIANKIGFFSTNQFRTVMKKRYKTLPKEIRKTKYK